MSWLCLHLAERLPWLTSMAPLPKSQHQQQIDVLSRDTWLSSAMFP
jgi:hypothetical protein